MSDNKPLITVVIKTTATAFQLQTKLKFEPKVFTRKEADINAGGTTGSNSLSLHTDRVRPPTQFELEALHGLSMKTDP